MKKKKYKIIFEVIADFEDLIDEETFKKEYKGNLLKLVKFMCKEEGMFGWYTGEIKLASAEFFN